MLILWNVSSRSVGLSEWRICRNRSRYRYGRVKGPQQKRKKDGAIQRRHYLQIQLDYWRGKCERFTMTEVPDGFSNRQGVDIGIIGRYARLYLKTVFDRIYTVKGATTAAFRKMWGLQDEYPRRNEPIMFTIVSIITIACIGRKEYDRWAQYAADEERYNYGESCKPRFEKTMAYIYRGCQGCGR